MCTSGDIISQSDTSIAHCTHVFVLQDQEKMSMFGRGVCQAMVKWQKYQNDT
jgi:hypothetical protein